MAPMSAFSILRKWLKIGKMTPDELLIHTTAKVYWKTLFYFLKFIIFVEIERKNDYSGYHANYNDDMTHMQ